MVTPYRTPRMKKKPEAGQVAQANVGVRLFDCLQRAVVSLGELLGSKLSDSIDTLVNGGFPQLVEAYRLLVRDAQTPCLTPCGVFQRPDGASENATRVGRAGHRVAPGECQQVHIG